MIEVVHRNSSQAACQSNSPSFIFKLLGSESGPGSLAQLSLSHGLMEKLSQL